MENIKVKVGRDGLTLTIDHTVKGELTSTGYSRKLAWTQKFETIKVGGEEYGLMLMLTKKVPSAKTAKEEPKTKTKVKEK